MTREVDSLIAFNNAGNTGCWAAYTTNGKHGDGSYHSRYGTPSSSGDTGLAVDFNAANNNPAKLKACAEWFLKQAPKLFELFYTPLGVSVKRGEIVHWTVAGHYDHVHAAVTKGTFLVPPSRPIPAPTPTLEIDMVHCKWNDGALAYANPKGEVFCPEAPGRPTAQHYGGIPDLRDDAKKSFSGTVVAIVPVDDNNSRAGYYLVDESWKVDEFKFDASVKQFFK